MFTFVDGLVVKSGLSECQSGGFSHFHLQPLVAAVRFQSLVFIRCRIPLSVNCGTSWGLKHGT